MTSPVIEIHEEIFYQSAEFWVGAAFIMVVAFLFFPMSKIIKQLINKRIERIKDELQEAETLKLDAQKLYAEYERKFLNVNNEVAEIIANQKEIIEQTKSKKMRELNSQLKNKETEANAKIDQAFKQIRKEINTLIYQKSLAILSQIIRTKLTKDDYNKLIDKSISNIENIEIGKNNG